MVITRKPKQDIDERKVQEVISRGGTAAVKVEDKPDTGAAITRKIRFQDRELFERMEAVRKAEPVRLPQNLWMLQAIAAAVEDAEARLFGAPSSRGSDSQEQGT